MSEKPGGIDLTARADEAAAALRPLVGEPPEAAVILGSGLGPLVEKFTDQTVVPYDRIPHFPTPTVAGHAGNLVLGSVEGARAILLQGRFHYYEGHDLDAVTFPVRVLQRLGVRTLILTAAVGGVRPELRPGNIAVLTGPDGKLLVDAGIGVSRPQLGKALAELGSEPVAHLINTHWHFDHADGNEWVHSEGAAILAHDNTLRHLRSAQRVEDWNFDFPPSPAGALPTETFAEDKTLKLNNTTLQLTHHDGAHTDGDISVAFAEADVIHTGDIYWNGIYPFIDYSTGGSIDGTIKGVDAILAAAGVPLVLRGDSRFRGNGTETSGMIPSRRN